MEALKTKVGFKGTLRDFFAFMRKDRQFYFPNTDQGRADYLTLAETYLTAMKQRLPEYFGLLPKAGFDRQACRGLSRGTRRRAALLCRHAGRFAPRHLLRAPVGR